MASEDRYEYYNQDGQKYCGCPGRCSAALHSHDLININRMSKLKQRIRSHFYTPCLEFILLTSDVQFIELQSIESDDPK